MKWVEKEVRLGRGNETVSHCKMTRWMRMYMTLHCLGERRCIFTKETRYRPDSGVTICPARFGHFRWPYGHADQRFDFHHGVSY